VPKIIREGINSERFKEYMKGPKPGMVETCGSCFSLLITTETDIGFFGIKTFSRDKATLPTWTIICPACGEKVVFVDANPPARLYSLLNPVPLKMLLGKKAA